MTPWVDYDRRQYAVYSAGRSLSPARIQLWIDVLGKYIRPYPRPAILDLGCGTGIYSRLAAEAFDASVVGVDPAARMREVATHEHAHPRVRYLDGSAESIPLDDRAVDVALLSNVIHHVRDRDACVAELRRVVRLRGPVLIRGTLRGSIPSVPFFDFFPTAREIDERRMPSADEVVAMFAGRGFEHVASEVIEQESAPSLLAYYERVKVRAISTLELISDGEFEEGLGRMRLAAEREDAPRPITEHVDLVVLRRS